MFFLYRNKGANFIKNDFSVLFFKSKKLEKSILFCSQQRLTIEIKNER